MRAPSTRAEYGDWQTPDDLAARALSRVRARLGSRPRTILGPTCGEGAFLAAAARRAPGAALAGYEINPRYAAVAAARVKSTIHTADFFAIDWEREIASMADP